MALKYNVFTGTFDYVGAKGDKGDSGVGVPVSGSTGQFLVKKSNTNYDTEWANQAVSSVNSKTGTVVLTADDISDTSTTKKFTTASDISKLASLSTVATTGSYTDLSNKPTLDDITAGTTNKHFTATEQTKLTGIATSANNYTHPNHSGDVTSAGDGATTIANLAVTTGKIADQAVTYAKMQNMTTSRILGRTTAGNGVVEELSAVTSFVASATTTSEGKVELATGAETTTGTSDTLAVTPDGLAGSDYGKRSYTIQLSSPNSVPVVVQDQLGSFFVTSELNGYNLVGVALFCTVASSSGTPTVQVRNVTDSVDMLSTKVTIDANEKSSITASVPPVINTAVDDVATGDELALDVDVSGTGTKGLHVVLTFQKP